MAVKKTPEEIMAGMDEAAKLAKDEFEKFPDETKKIIASWLRKWYLKAGYRRLGRQLVAYAKECEKTGK